MRIELKEKAARSGRSLKSRGEDAFVATVMFIALLVIMMMLATAGAMAIIHLQNEVRVLERQQIKRLDISVTNSVALAGVNIPKMQTK
ncbi:MAG TPA: hypothetical protein VGY98_20315 [Verrucomicrobiae bacterium]|nr:hypothetical protein [Verrucomicrobiae bacterium]